MKLIKKKNSDVSTLTSKYLGTNNNNNNNCIYIALFPVGSVQSALQYIITPATTAFKGHVRQPSYANLGEAHDSMYP